MWQLLTSIAVIILSLNQWALTKQVLRNRKAINAVMDLLIAKFTAEQIVNQQHIDAIIDDTINKIRRDSDDVD